VVHKTSIPVNQVWETGLMAFRLIVRGDTTLLPKGLGVRAKISGVTSSHSNHVWAEDSGPDRGASAINSQEALGLQRRRDRISCSNYNPAAQGRSEDPPVLQHCPQTALTPDFTAPNTTVSLQFHLH